MTRTFQHRVSWPAFLMIVMIAGFAVYFFWHRTPAMALVAFLLVCLDVVMIERSVHTAYTLTDDAKLVVDRGRFSKRMQIPLGEIHRMEVRKTAFGVTRYVLVEYGERRLVSLQPANPVEFVAEAKKRINKIGK